MEWGICSEMASTHFEYSEMTSTHFEPSNVAVGNGALGPVGDSKRNRMKLSECSYNERGKHMLNIKQTNKTFCLQ